MAASVPAGRSDGRSDGRSERRISQILAAEFSCPDESVPKEMTFTENMSIRGARVTTVRRWQAGTRVLVTFTGMAFGLKEGSLTASATGVATSPLG